MNGYTLQSVCETCGDLYTPSTDWEVRMERGDKCEVCAKRTADRVIVVTATIVTDTSAEPVTLADEPCSRRGDLTYHAVHCHRDHGALPGIVGTPHHDPIPKLRDESPDVPAPLALPMTFDGELALFG